MWERKENRWRSSYGSALAVCQVVYTRTRIYALDDALVVRVCARIGHAAAVVFAEGRDTRARDLCSSSLYIGGPISEGSISSPRRQPSRPPPKSKSTTTVVVREYDYIAPIWIANSPVPDHTAVSSPAAADRDGCCGSLTPTLSWTPPPPFHAHASRVHGWCAHGTSGFAYTLANVRRIRAERALREFRSRPLNAPFNFTNNPGS